MSETPEYMEINRLKGQIEATKHYYAILISKNVAKVEDAMKWADDSIDSLDLAIKGIEEEILVLSRREKSARSNFKKALIASEVGLLSRLATYLRNNRTKFYNIHHSLKQVL